MRLKGPRFITARVSKTLPRETVREHGVSGVSCVGCISAVEASYQGTELWQVHWRGKAGLKGTSAANTYSPRPLGLELKVETPVIPKHTYSTHLSVPAPCVHLCTWAYKYHYRFNLNIGTKKKDLFYCQGFCAVSHRA